ncbi:HalOD1 output domain-containing protein [Halostella salina]|uniref:HalOD1 output domain-containing protein n=1 Tax=Halostella salina TaxID=1547897 RepID=UPI000EF7AE11|nr:HalOD1 output domain-containing protein [Halostella salina]
MISDHDQRSDPDHRYELSRDEPPSEAVLTAVATASGDEPLPSAATGSDDVLPPLYDAVDPDALDALFRQESEQQPGFGGEVTFPYHGYEVTVHGGDHLTLRRRTPELVG